MLPLGLSSDGVRVWQRQAVEVATSRVDDSGSTGKTRLLRAAMGGYLSWVGSQREDQTRKTDSLFITAAFAWHACYGLVVKDYGT